MAESGISGVSKSFVEIGSGEEHIVSRIERQGIANNVLVETHEAYDSGEAYQAIPPYAFVVNKNPTVLLSTVARKRVNCFSRNPFCSASLE
jgi:hypothetical protein